MSILKFQDRLDDMVVAYAHETHQWSGDIIDCCDYAKDRFCYQFLLHAESWWDDILPPIIINQTEFIGKLYDNSDESMLSNMIRGDIYLYLEDRLRDMVQESYDRVHNIQPEPFAGYERGQ
jgi:hypothetical protein